VVPTPLATITGSPDTSSVPVSNACAISTRSAGRTNSSHPPLDPGAAGANTALVSSRSSSRPPESLNDATNIAC
jgi:hypothetical protein